MELPTKATYTSLNPQSPAYSESHSSGDEPEVDSRNLKRALTNPSISSVSSQTPKGYRAAEAFLRPSPIYVNGSLDSYVFDLRNCKFTLNLTAKAPTPSDTPTEMYLPEFHFPESGTVISVSGGKWEIDYQEFETIKVQRLRWWHAEGEQNIKIEGVKRKAGEFASPSGDDVTYLEQCQKGDCLVM